MNIIKLSVILASLLFASCPGYPVRRTLNPLETYEAVQESVPYIITDHKNSDEPLPEWVSKWLEGGIKEAQSLDAFEDRLVFISENKGSNFNALGLWNNGFSLEQDFPRLAAARIKERFISSTPFPDEMYGSFFIHLIRAASDAPWTGAVREDDFWIRRKYLPTEDEVPEEAREEWVFLILVTMEKSLFASQLDAVFRSVNPSPRPSREQTNAVNRIRDRFLDDF